MAETTLVPPTPTINQSDSPEQIAETVQNVQAIFDKVAPDRKSKPEPVPRPELEKQAQTTPTPVEPAAQPEKTAPDKPAEESHKVPSFIEKALEVPDEVKPETPSAHTDEEWPEELPTFKSSDEAKNNWKKWRQEYAALKKEAEQLRSRPAVDETLTQKLTFLENQNKEMSTTLSRMGVENHIEFQNRILRPMQQAYSTAAKIVQDAGGDPNDLAKALSLSGKAHFEALDSVFEGLPESAKVEAHQEISNWRRLENQRKAALADAPRTAAALKKADLERQYATISKQKEEMQQMFDDAVKTLRDEAGVEVLKKSDDPDAKWWNDQADQIVSGAKKLFLDNTDMKKVALATVLAPMADTYRKLWLTERNARMKEQKATREKYGAEPNLSESGGNFNGNSTIQDDLKKPFKDVFLREFHKAQAAGVR